MPGPISDLASALLDRKMQENPDQFKTAISRPVDRSESGMSPHTLATIGGLADAASTYAFMKRGNMRETNPLVNAIAKGNPEMTGLTAIGGLLATKGLTHLIGKKWPKAADAIAANLGAQQLGLGVHNLANTTNMSYNNGKTGSFDEYKNSINRSGQMESLKSSIK